MILNARPQCEIEATHEPAAQRNPSQPAALAAGVCSCRIRHPEAHARSAHAALPALGPGHRPAGRTPESCHRIRGRQNRRCGRRPAQRHAGEPDRAGHRGHRRARRAIPAGEGLHRRGHCHQHAVHAGRVLPPRRTQASRAGVQPGERPAAGRLAVSGDRRPVGALGRQ